MLPVPPIAPPTVRVPPWGPKVTFPDVVTGPFHAAVPEPSRLLPARVRASPEAIDTPFSQRKPPAFTWVPPAAVPSVPLFSTRRVTPLLTMAGPAKLFACWSRRVLPPLLPLRVNPPAPVIAEVTVIWELNPV